MNAPRQAGGKVGRAAPSEAAVDPTAEYLLRRRRGLLFLVLPIVVVMFVASWLARDDPQWRAAVDWARAQERRWSQDGCPVVSAPLLPGDAREEFAEALRLARSWPSDLRQELSDHADAEPFALSTEQVTAAADAVAALRRAAHHTENFAIGSRRVGPDCKPLDDLLEFRDVFRALRGTAGNRAAVEPRAAFAVLLDGLVAAADLATAGIGIERLLGGLMLQEVATAIDDPLLRAAEPIDLEHLDTVLSRILACWPPEGDWIERELAHTILFLEEAETVRAEDIGVRSYWQTWVAGFSPRGYARLAAQAQLQQWQRVEPSLRLPGTSHADRITMLSGLAASFGRQQAGSLAHVDLVATLDIHTKALTALQLLRGAVQFHQGRTIDVPDPFGAGPVQVVTDGARANLQSVQPDLRRLCERRR